MGRQRTVKPARNAIWTEEQEQALEGVRACGFVPVEDAIENLMASVWGNTRAPPQVREAKAALNSAGLPGSAIWLSWRRDLENRLYAAVTGSKIALYAWPAHLDDSGLYIQSAPQDVTIVQVKIVKALKPLHGGLPTKTLGLRPGMIKRLASKGVSEFPPSDCLVLFRRSEFLAWAEAERLKGRWPSQLNRGMKLRGRSRTIINQAVDLALCIIDDGRWTNSEPVTKLAQIANEQLSREGKPPISDDTYARALDKHFSETGEKKVKRYVRKRRA